MCTIQSRTSLSSACATINEWADEEGLDAFENSDIYIMVSRIENCQNIMLIIPNFDRLSLFTSLFTVAKEILFQIT